MHEAMLSSSLTVYPVHYIHKQARLESVIQLPRLHVLASAFMQSHKMITLDTYLGSKVLTH